MTGGIRHRPCGFGQVVVAPSGPIHARCRIWLGSGPGEQWRKDGTLWGWAAPQCGAQASGCSQLDRQGHTAGPDRWISHRSSWSHISPRCVQHPMRCSVAVSQAQQSMSGVGCTTGTRDASDACAWCASKLAAAKWAVAWATAVGRCAFLDCSSDRCQYELSS